MQDYIVYKHITPSNKIYIGITKTRPERRWKKGDGYKGCTYFYYAILKYGWDNIQHVILFSGLTEEEATRKEKELITEYKSNDKEYGYNLTTGGEHCNVNDEVRARMSAAQKGEKSKHYGKQRSEETKRKIRETKAKIKSYPFGSTGENHHLSIKVSQCDDEWNEIKIWGSARDAERNLGIDHSTIIRCCKGKGNIAGGYFWKYAEAQI